MGLCARKGPLTYFDPVLWILELFAKAISENSGAVSSEPSLLALTKYGSKGRLSHKTRIVFIHYVLKKLYVFLVSLSVLVLFLFSNGYPPLNMLN